jgi:hypothetical protein
VTANKEAQAGWETAVLSGHSERVRRDCSGTLVFVEPCWSSVTPMMFGDTPLGSWT